MERENKFEFMTPLQVWSDFNPIQQPLEPTIAREYVKDGVIFTAMYFTASADGDEQGKTRVYTMIARPENAEKSPVVLVLGDFGTVVGEETVLRYATKGFACAVMDYAGETDENKFCTIYSDSRKYCNLALSDERLYSAVPSARDTVWYYWALMARREITLLASLPYIDKDSINLLCIRSGSYIGWQVAAMDGRVKTVCVVHGYEAEHRTVCPEEDDCWLSGVSVRSYSQFISVPVLYVGSSNDSVFDADDLDYVLSAVPGEAFITFSVGLDGKITEYELNTVRKFFETGGKLPSQPKITLKRSEGALYADLASDGEGTAEIWYSSSAIPNRRVWKKAAVEKLDGEFLAKIEEESPVTYLFGRVVYGNLSLNTKIVKADNKDLTGSPRRSRIIYDTTMGTDGLIPLSDKDIISGEPIAIKKGALNRGGLTALEDGFAIYVDCKGIEENTVIQLDACSKVPADVRVTIRTSSDDKEESFRSEFSVKSGDAWQRIKLGLNDFKDKDMVSPSGWGNVYIIEFIAGKDVLFNNILWV